MTQYVSKGDRVINDTGVDFTHNGQVLKAGLTYEWNGSSWFRVSSAATTIKQYEMAGSPSSIETMIEGNTWRNTGITQTVGVVSIPAGAVSIWKSGAWEVTSAVLLTGTAAPASNLGKIGDDYTDTVTGNHYKKTDVGWTLLANIITSSSQLSDSAAIELAKTNATSAKASVDDMTSDNLLSPVEKITLRSIWDTIAGEKAGLEAQATALSVTTEKTTYTNAFAAFGQHLNGGTALTVGNIPLIIADAGLGVTSAITGATTRSLSTAYSNAKIALINKNIDATKVLANNAATTSTWYGVSGTGKPADNANYTTNTNQLTDGANLGLTANHAYIGGTPQANIANASLSVGTNGVLYNNGSPQGQVTIGGLGYGGDLNATRNTGAFATLAGAIPPASLLGYIAQQTISYTYATKIFDSLSVSTQVDTALVYIPAVPWDVQYQVVVNAQTGGSALGYLCRSEVGGVINSSGAVTDGFALAVGRTTYRTSITDASIYVVPANTSPLVRLSRIGAGTWQVAITIAGVKV